MTKVTSRVITTDVEIKAAIARDKVYEQFAPRAVAASYRRKEDTVVIRFASEIEVTLPRKLMQGCKTPTRGSL